VQNRNTPISNAFPDCYTKTYKIKDVASSLVFDQHMTSHTVYAGNYSGNANQQWLIMPTFPGSNNAFIISYANGWIMDRNTSSNDLYCYNGRTHGNDNQKWIFEDASNNNFFVHSKGTSYVWDRHTRTNNIYNGSKTGNANQQFIFTPMNPIGNQLSNEVVNYNISATMPPELTGFNEQYTQDAKIGEVLVSKTIIPFPVVNDPSYPIGSQVQYTPYYRLERRQYWRLMGYKQYCDGDEEKTTVSTTTGCITQNSSTIKSTLNFSYDYEQKLTIGNENKIGLELGQNLQTTMGLEYAITNTVTRSYEQNIEYELSRTAATDQLFFFYELTDEYRLYRMNETGENYMLRWKYVNPAQAPLYRCYPNAGSSSLRSLTTDTYLTKVNNNASNIDVSVSSPSAGSICLSIQHPKTESNGNNFEKENIINIYSNTGVLVRSIKQTSQKQEYDLGLSSGVYIIRFISDGNSINKKLFVK
jgi:hypothetical protein